MTDKTRTPDDDPTTDPIDADAPVAADVPADEPLDAQPTPLTHHEPVSAHTDTADGHVDEHMSDDHGHGDERLGPIDWVAWSYALIGLLAGVVVVIAFWLAVA